jgi:hypothetical protein
VFSDHEKNLKRRPTGFAGDWFDLAMAGIAATVLLGLPLFVLFFP